jgi:hypothetical protein
MLTEKQARLMYAQYKSDKLHLARKINNEYIDIIFLDTGRIRMIKADLIKRSFLTKQCIFFFGVNCSSYENIDCIDESFEESLENYLNGNKKI